MTFVERLEDRLLSNPRADRVRDVAALTRRSTRSRRGVFRAEGPQNVREAVRLALSGSGADAAGLPRPEAVYVTLRELERHPDVAADLEALEVRGGLFIRAVTPEVLGAMTDAVTPQGMLAVCRIPEVTLQDALADTRLVCVLARVQDPGNAGTVVRAADAAGADAVVLSEGSVDPYNPKAVRSTAGSLFHLPVLAGAGSDELLAVLAEQGITAAATSGHARDELFTVDLPPRIAWILGNEAHGLDEATLAAAPLQVRIPLAGHAESLNVHPAATVCLFETLRRRQARA